MEAAFTCRIFSEEGRILFESQARGIAPLLGVIRDGLFVKGGRAEDKIVGKAAALLYAHMGVTEVYADVMSRAGLAALEGFGIKATYGVLTDGIVNRRGDGNCPMEETVKETDDPETAYRLLSQKAEELKKSARGGEGSSSARA